MSDAVSPHKIGVTHSYHLHYPEHFPRKSDPHYADFRSYHDKTRSAARCYTGERIGFQDCRDNEGSPCVIDADGQMSGLELHHSHIEFAVQNGVDLAALEKDYPGVSSADIGAWVESGANFRWLCTRHHRANGGGAHAVSHSDWEASQYVQGMVTLLMREKGLIA